MNILNNLFRRNSVGEPDTATEKVLPARELIAEAAETLDTAQVNQAILTYLMPLGARWLVDFLLDKDRFEERGLAKVYEDDGSGVFLLRLADGTLLHPDEDSFNRYDLDDPAAVGWLFAAATAYVVRDPRDGKLYTDGEFEEQPGGLWGHWVPDSEKALVNVSVGGTTDLYEIEAIWPHYLTASGNLVPLAYAAEFIYANQCYQFFYDASHAAWNDRQVLPDKTLAMAWAIVAKDPTIRGLPDWIKLLPLKNASPLPLLEPQKYFLDDVAPLGPLWIQSSEVPAEPFNHFVAEIGSVGNAMFGDAGSIYIFTDGEGNFKGIAQSY